MKEKKHWDSALVIGIVCGIIIVATAVYLVIMSVTSGRSQTGTQGYHQKVAKQEQPGQYDPVIEQKKVNWMKRCVVMPDTPNNEELANIIRRNPGRYPKGYPSVTVTGPDGTVTKDLPLCCVMCYNKVMDIDLKEKKGKKGDNLKRYTRNLLIRIAQSGSSGT